MSKVQCKLFGQGCTINIPDQLTSKMNSELRNKLNAKSKRWANKEIKAQAEDLIEMLKENTHKLTGRMADSWKVSYPRSVAKNGFVISFFNDATSDRGYPYPWVEEFGTGYYSKKPYREGHHTTENTINNDFLPSVLTRMRQRFRGEFE